MLIIVLNYIVLALTFTVGKNVLSYAKPLFTVGFRMTTAGLALLGYLYIRNKKALYIQRKDAGLFLLVVLVHIYIPFMSEFWSLQYMNSAKMNMLYSATPFLAALMSYVLLNERLSMRKIAAICVGFIGLLPVLMQQYSLSGVHQEFLRISYPELLAIIAVVSATYAWFVMKKLLQRGYSFILVNGASMLVGGLLSLITSLIFEGADTSPVFELTPFLCWIGLLIILANIIFYNMQAYLMKQYSISLVTLAGFLCPLFGAFFGWLCLGEIITWHYYCSLAIITLALSMYYYDQ